MSTVLFSEIQRFRQPWIWGILFGVTALMAWALIEQLIFDKPWGDNPTSDSGLIVICLFLVAMMIFIYSLYLKTEVTKEELRIRFYPVVRKRIPWEDVLRAYVRTYRPIREFGGWGIRFGGRAGRAYNVSGNKGVQLELRGGKKLLIGTLQPEEWEQILQSIRK